MSQGDYNGFILLVVLFVLWLTWRGITQVILPWIKHRSRDSIFRRGEDTE